MATQRHQRNLSAAVAGQEADAVVVEVEFQMPQTLVVFVEQAVVLPIQTDQMYSEQAQPAVLQMR